MSTVNHSLSIFLPTFKRYNKVCRNLVYLDLLTEDSYSLGLIKDINLSIYDGTPLSYDNLGYQEVQNLLLKLRRKLDISYLHFPEMLPYHRHQEFLSRCSTEFVMMLGDDDFLIPTYITDLLDLFAGSPGVSAVSGRLLNVRGFDHGKLMIDDAERPYSGFVLDSAIPEVRISEFSSLNAVGCSAIAYSIQRRVNMKAFLDEVAHIQTDLYGGGLELIHQVITLLSGSVVFSDHPLLLRDFTYIDYKPALDRSASSLDPWPYYGESCVDVLMKIIAREGSIFNFGDPQLREFCLNLMTLPSSLSASKDRMERLLPRKKISQEIYSFLEKPLLDSAYEAWRLTYRTCYDKSVILGLGNPYPGLMSRLTFVLRRLVARLSLGIFN